MKSRLTIQLNYAGDVFSWLRELTNSAGCFADILNIKWAVPCYHGIAQVHTAHF